MADMKFHTFQLFLKHKGMRCVNVVEGRSDVYYIGKDVWSDEQIKDEGYSIMLPCDENDFSRYMVMLEKSDKIKFLL